MKTKNLILAVLALVLAACSNDVFVGEQPEFVPEQMPEVEEDSAAIIIDGLGANAATGTRAVGADAANLLGGLFRVYATNMGGVVFNNYEVKWLGGPTSSSTNAVGWEYQGYMSKAPVPALQNIKFWDYSSSRYDFVAFSGLKDNQKITSVNANTYIVDASNMYDLYYANRVSAAPTHILAVAGVSPEYVPYGTPVKFNFRRATARLRVGFYENIPGYAVKDVRFYYDDNLTAANGTSVKTDVALNGIYPVSGEYTITYDVNNNAHAEFSATGTTANHRLFGALDYGRAECTVPGYPYLMGDGIPDLVGEKSFLGTTSATATYALATENIDGVVTPLCPWHPILPFETNATELTLRVDYTLISVDGTGEVIHVKGAEARVPVEYCQWRPNYSYTYIFKINNSAGTSGDDTDPSGLYPITFDAVVSEVFDGAMQEEITIENPEVP